MIKTNMNKIYVKMNVLVLKSAKIVDKYCKL